MRRVATVQPDSASSTFVIVDPRGAADRPKSFAAFPFFILFFCYNPLGIPENLGMSSGLYYFPHQPGAVRLVTNSVDAVFIPHVAGQITAVRYGNRTYELPRVTKLTNPPGGGRHRPGGWMQRVTTWAPVEPKC